MEKSVINEIQNEYKRIDSRWLMLHYKTTFGLVIFSLLVECIMTLIMCNTEERHTTILIFFLKFLIFPFVLNSICIIIDYIIMHSIHVSQKIKLYSVSLLFVAICFILFTVHIVFSALYFIFAVPILLTTIYANYKLTTVTSAACIAAVIISELFIKWDIDKVSIMENSIRFGDFIVSIFILVAFSAVCMVVIFFEREKNAASIQKELERYQLQKRLQTDELTGICNRIAFRDAIKDMEEDSADNSYIFVMIDLDNFKKLNDSLGHVMGDHCLVEFGRILTENCKDATPFRYGGDEFCVLFRNHTMEEVVETCGQIQSDLKKVNVGDQADISVTASFGISSYSKDLPASMMILNTDKTLYEAKAVKNTIRIYQASINVNEE